MTSPTGLLADALRRDPGRPFVTYHDATPARVELSVATFDNWVAKTAGLLADDLGVRPPAVVSVVLPAHWLGLVWAQAVWTAGARLVLSPDPDADVSVRAVDAGPDAPGELVVVRTDPLGGPAGAGVPAGATDYGRDVLGQPDRFPAGPEPEDPLLARLMVEAGAEAVAARSRLLVAAEHTDAAVVRQALLVPLLTDSSSVLVHGITDPGRLAAIATEERAVTTGRR